jgi:hypothetical protein
MTPLAMQRLKVILACTLLGLNFSGICRNMAAASEIPDAAAFKDPPLSARLRAYWDWINGAVSLEQLACDLEAMKEKGMGGGQMWDSSAHRNPNGFVPPGPALMGPESVAAIRHSLKEAKRLELQLGLPTSSGWNAGGPWATQRTAANRSQSEFEGAADRLPRSHCHQDAFSAHSRQNRHHPRKRKGVWAQLSRGLNGNDLGMVWNEPFRMEIAGVAHAGENQLEIEVANLMLHAHKPHGAP